MLFRARWQVAAAAGRLLSARYLPFTATTHPSLFSARRALSHSLPPCCLISLKSISCTCKHPKILPTTRSITYAIFFRLSMTSYLDLESFLEPPSGQKHRGRPKGSKDGPRSIDAPPRGRPRKSKNAKTSVEAVTIGAASDSSRATTGV